VVRYAGQAPVRGWHATREAAPHPRSGQIRSRRPPGAAHPATGTVRRRAGPLPCHYDQGHAVPSTTLGADHGADRPRRRRVPRNLGRPDADSIRALDAIIAEFPSGVTRELWEGILWGGTEQQIIGYRHIVIARRGKPTVEWFVVGLARQKNHLSVYINASKDDKNLIQHYKGRLGKVKMGAAALNFASIESLELDAFRALLQDAARLTPDAT
jgi:hypothetical protein